MFVQRLNSKTGELEWADAAAAADDVLDAVAGSSYLDMLNDAARNEAFAAAIAATSHGRSVLDIGTGTGVLALLAAAAGATAVTACEIYPPMVTTAVAVAAANVARGGDRVRVVPKRSSDLTVGPGGAPAAPALACEPQPDA
jgi:protein arginine N-methyltransferase 7